MFLFFHFSRKKVEKQKNGKSGFFIFSFFLLFPDGQILPGASHLATHAQRRWQSTGYAILCYTILYYTKFYQNTSHYVVLSSIILYCTVLNYDMQNLIILYYTIPHYTMLYNARYCLGPDRDPQRLLSQDQMQARWTNQPESLAGWPQATIGHLEKGEKMKKRKLQAFSFFYFSFFPKK